MRLKLILSLINCLCLALLSQAQWPLDSCISYAYHNNISIKQSELNIELAEINKSSNVGGLLPSINGQATHGYNWGQRIDQFTNQFATERIRSNNFGVNTNMNLFSGFSQYNSVLQSNMDIETQKWNFEKMRNDIALNVASAYLNVLMTEEMMNIAKGNTDNTEKQVSRLRKMYNAGQIAEGTLNDMLSQHATNQATEVSATNNYSIARLSLMQLLILNDEQMSTFDIVRPKIEDVGSLEMLNDPSVTVQAALSNFPDIKSAKSAMASAIYGERIAKGAISPRLSASFTYGTGYSGAARTITGSPQYVSYPVGTVLSTGDVVISIPQAYYTTENYKLKPFNEQWKDNVNRSLFFSLTIPIFNGFSTYTGMQRAKVNRLKSEYNLDQTKITLSQNVQKAHADAKASLASYNANMQSKIASEKAFQWAEARYEQGMINATEYADARNRMLSAQATEARSKYDYFFKIKVLEFYMGKPLSIK